MKKALSIAIFSIVTAGGFPVLSHACTAPQATTTESSIQSTSDENWGVYEWNSSTGQWVKLASGYHPFYETEVLRSSDVIVPSGALGGGGGGGGGGGVIIQGGQAGVAASDSPADRKGGDATIQCDTTELPPVIVTASPLSFGGSLLTLIWRGQMLNGVGGGAQRSTTSQPVPAPETAEEVTCDTEVDIRRANASHSAARYGLLPGRWHRGRRITFRWSTGTVETYQSNGTLSHQFWMDPVPGTCQDA